MSKAAAKPAAKASPAPPVSASKSVVGRPGAVNTAIDSIRKSAAAATSGETAIISAAGQTASTAPISHRRTQMESDFDRFRAYDKLEDGVDSIGPTGWGVLCQELGISAASQDAFILSWSLGATQSSCVSRSEWMHAGHLHKLDHLGSLKAAMKNWQQAVRTDEASFTLMYEAAYDFARGDDDKLLPLEKAIRLWQVLLTPDIFPLITTWISWCATEYKKPVSRDLWRSVLDFRSVKLDAYDSANNSFPCAIDDFVDFSRDKMAQTNSTNKK